jgi:hypothetical protein
VSLLLSRSSGVVSRVAADDERAIRDALEEFVANMSAGNAAPLAAPYTADAAMLPTDATRIEGRAKVQEVLQSFVDAKIAYRTSTRLTRASKEILPGMPAPSEAQFRCREWRAAPHREEASLVNIRSNLGGSVVGLNEFDRKAWADLSSIWRSVK